MFCSVARLLLGLAQVRADLALQRVRGVAQDRDDLALGVEPLVIVIAGGAIGDAVAGEDHRRRERHIGEAGVRAGDEVLAPFERRDSRAAGEREGAVIGLLERDERDRLEPASLGCARLQPRGEHLRGDILLGDRQLGRTGVAAAHRVRGEEGDMRLERGLGRSEVLCERRRGEEEGEEDQGLAHACLDSPP